MSYLFADVVAGKVCFFFPVSRNYTNELQLIPWSRVLPDKLTVRQLITKFPAFYGTCKFITAFTRARHLFLF